LNTLKAAYQKAFPWDKYGKGNKDNYAFNRVKAPLGKFKVLSPLPLPLLFYFFSRALSFFIWHRLTKTAVKNADYTPEELTALKAK
jgi:hypothetical protein